MEELNSIEQIRLVIRNVRKRKKIRQKDLANYTNLSIFGISKFERKGEDIKLSTLIKMLKLLGIKVFIDYEQ
jgi:transcriptional regulator with XRE-family HTH domain